MHHWGQGEEYHCHTHLYHLDKLTVTKTRGTHIPSIWLPECIVASTIFSIITAGVFTLDEDMFISPHARSRKCQTTVGITGDSRTVGTHYGTSFMSPFCQEVAPRFLEILRIPGENSRYQGHDTHVQLQNTSILFKKNLRHQVWHHTTARPLPLQVTCCLKKCRKPHPKNESQFGIF